MRKIYLFAFIIVLLILVPTTKASAQCTISGLNTTYCVDDAAATLSNGTNYYGAGISGNTFTPSVAGVGTHQVVSTTGIASSYTINQTGTFNPLTSATPTSLTLLDNNESGAITIGFTFNFFGNNYTQLRIGSNGQVGFNSSVVEAAFDNDRAMPNATDPDNIIAVAWDDLNPAVNGTIEYFLTGVAPFRKFVVSYTNVARSAGVLITSQLQLHETTHIIEIHTTNAVFTFGATQGIENVNGSVAYVVPGRNNSTWSVTNDYVAFIPNCLDIKTVTVQSLPVDLGIVPPTAKTICVGNTVDITIPGSQVGVTYQLRNDFNNAVLSAMTLGTGANLTITSSTLSANTIIKVYARNNASLFCDLDFASKATVTVNANPIITTQPTTATVCEDGTAQFNVIASGSGLSYQWRANGVTPVGTNSATLTLTGVTSAMSGTLYDVVITSACAPVTSSSVALIVNEKPEVTVHPSNKIICQGLNTNFTINAGTTTSPTYQWEVSINGGSTYSTIANGAVYSGAITNTLNLTGTPLGNNGYLYRAIISGTCLPSATSNVAQLTVNANAAITTQPTTVTVCQDGTAQFNVIASGSGLSYQWRETIGGVTSIINNGGVYGGATTATLTLTTLPTSFNARKYDVVITGTCGVIASARVDLFVTTKPTAFANDAAICSGTTTNINISNPNSVASTTFMWTIQSATNVSGASASVVPANNISQLLTSTDGVSNGSVRYLIQPTAAGCNGPTYVVNVVVTPIPTVAASPQTICSGSNSSVAITNPNGVAGTQFNWVVQAVSNVSGHSGGSGTVISQLLVSANGTNTGTVTYRITPTANGCFGNYIDVVITVNPRPAILNPPFSLIQSICSGTSLNFTPTSSVSGTTFNWTASLFAAPGTLTGITSPGTGAITDTPVNSGNSNAVVIYTITPSNGSCTGPPVNFVVTVYPVPTAFANPQTICSETSTSIAITNPNSVVGTSFSWTVTPLNVLNASSGNGNSISQVLKSADGINSGTATYHITPSANGCSGPIYNVVVTVKPVPVITNNAVDLTQQICSGQALNFSPTSTIVGTTFTWSSTTSGPIDGSSVSPTGSGAIVDSPVNTGNVSGTVTYTITPKYNGCDGQSKVFIVSVKPLPSATASDIIICSGENGIVTISSSPKNVTGTTYIWTAAATNVLGAADGNGSVINQTLSTIVNTTDGNVVYTITPSANGCNGPLSTAMITVNRSVLVNAGADFSVCENVAMPSAMPIPVTGTIGGSASSATWSIKQGSGTLSASVTSGGNVTATYTAVNADINNYVKLYLTTNDPAGPCVGKTDSLVIFVSKRARIVPLADQVLCEPVTINLSGFLVSGTATSGNWSVIIPGDGTGEGTLSVSSVTGNEVSATYDLLPADIGKTITFRLTANDPDGSGPCATVFEDVDIHINPSAKVSAGADFEVCSDQPVALLGSFSIPTSSVTWSGGDGSFSDPTDKNATYTLGNADIAAGGVLLRLTTNDPDGTGSTGPCSPVWDEVFVKVNPLPDPIIVLPDDTFAENDPPVTFIGFPSTGPNFVGTFTGPGIVAGTNIFDPSNANIGLNTITYSVINTITGCRAESDTVVIVNQISTIDFSILAEGESMPDARVIPTLCNKNGNARLIGSPPPSTTTYPAFFTSSPGNILGSDINGQYIETQGLPSGEYFITYSYTNPLNAKSELTKKLIVFAAPKSIIGAMNACVTDSVAFTDLSTIPNNFKGGTINAWVWDFDYANIKKTIQNPKMKYDNPGFYDVMLTVTTDQNCSTDTVKQIFIGTSPKVKFEASKICSGEDTKFKDLSTIGLGSIIQYSWDFGDQKILSFGGKDVPVPNPTHGDSTKGTYNNPSHKYSSFQSYNVTLSVLTDVGCVKDSTITVNILDYSRPVSSAGYRTDFENDPTAWLKVDEGKPTSWIFGTPTGARITNAYSGNDAWWTGLNSEATKPYFSSYYGNANSYVFGPCINLSALERPMISIKYWSDSQKNFDGAVLQYSGDGGNNWVTVGSDDDEGIDWYNGSNLSGQPGGQDNFAWTDSTGGWRDARYNLNAVPKDTVVFRIAFGSNTDNNPGTVLNGFAFDDIYIGEKTRNVLVEQFTSDNNPASAEAEQDISDLVSKDFIKLQYHVASAGFDQVNDDNPTDPAVRSYLYSVSRPPVSFMDGIEGEYGEVIFDGNTDNITLQELDRRSLEDPSFKIEIDLTQDATAAADVLKADITYTFVDSLQSFSAPIILQAVLVETGINGNINSLRKLLCGPEGLIITDPLIAGNEVAFSKNIEYNIDVPVVDGDSLFIIAFAQHKASRRILQAVIQKVTQAKQQQVPLGLPDDPAVAALKGLKIYPNPASKDINLFLGDILKRDYQWKLIDQRGVTVLHGDVNRDLREAQSLDITRVANGIYILAIKTSERTVRYMKIAVMN